jgi:ribose/xylose/arabinose/galactoside ABC-type transport system permease subunit
LEKQGTIIAKYQALVSEWNTISLICSVLFASAIIGLVMGIIYLNINTMIITIVLMFIFGAFEYRSRKIYVEAKREIEDEMFKLAGMKNPKLKELVDEGLVWG